MRFIRTILFAAALCGLGASAVASPADPKNNVEYLTLPEVQNTESGNKVEVIEFFDYTCPHCHVFDPMLSEWVKKQGANIAFKRVHIGRGGGVLPQQRLYYTLESMGLLDQYHAKVFAAIHEQRVRFNNDEAVFAWAEKAGIDRAKFIDTYRSFGVQAKTRRANSMMDAYKVDYWPQIAIDGRYITSPSQATEGNKDKPTEAEQQQAALQVMSFLVAKAKAKADKK